MTELLTLNALVFVCAALVGIVFHYISAWLQGQIDGSLVRYLFVDYPKRTALAVLSVMSAALGIILSHKLAGLDPDTVALMAAPMGYALDHAVNKGATP